MSMFVAGRRGVSARMACGHPSDLFRSSDGDPDSTTSPSFMQTNLPAMAVRQRWYPANPDQDLLVYAAKRGQTVRDGNACSAWETGGASESVSVSQ